MIRAMAAGLRVWISAHWGSVIALGRPEASMAVWKAAKVQGLDGALTPLTTADGAGPVPVAGAAVVGAVAGAVPPVVGYVAVTNTLDLTAFWLFAFLFLWQIPHFIAIAVYRYSDYVAAGIPIFVKKPPTERARRLARLSFYISLVVLLTWCAILIFYQ